ncbi:reticulon family protein, partial [Acinetobacter baumannii]
KSADVLLWRNKKTSASVLTSATIIWVVFVWLSYNFLTILGFILVLGMLVQFAWKSVSSIFNRSSTKVPRLVLPDEVFVNVGKLIGSEVNRALNFFQDVACGGNIKQILMVIAGLWAAAIIGSWCSFLTVIYIGFIAANTLPVLYEKYDDQIDGFVYKVVDQLQHNYRKVDAGVRGRIPAGKFMGRKVE